MEWTTTFADHGFLQCCHRRADRLFAAQVGFADDPPADVVGKVCQDTRHVALGEGSVQVSEQQLLGGVAAGGTVSLLSLQLFSQAHFVGHLLRRHGLGKVGGFIQRPDFDFAGARHGIGDTVSPTPRPRPCP